MHIAICDDNSDELSYISGILTNYNKEHGNAVSFEAFDNATDLLEKMKTDRFDLLFLDIVMPNVTGMDAAKEIRLISAEIPIVFLTSSREFAVESYRVRAEDYLIKPAQKTLIFEILDKQLEKLAQTAAYLTLKTSNGIIKLLYSQIVYVEVLNRTVKFYLSTGELREAYGYLADFETALLTDPNFYKPHRSYIINFRYVTALDGYDFTTSIGKKVPVARDGNAKTKTEYMKFLLKADDRSGTL